MDAEGKTKPLNFMSTSHDPRMNGGYTCALGGTLNTEFFNTDGSRLASLLARPEFPAPSSPTALMTVPEEEAGEEEEEEGKAIACAGIASNVDDAAMAAA